MRILRRIGRDGRGATSLKKSVLAASSGVALALSIIGGIGTAHADSFAGLGVADPSDRNDIVSPLPWPATVQIHNGTLSAQVTSLLPAPSGCSFIVFRASTYPALARLVAEADANLHGAALPADYSALTALVAKGHITNLVSPDDLAPFGSRTFSWHSRDSSYAVLQGCGANLSGHNVVGRRALLVSATPVSTGSSASPDSLGSSTVAHV